MRVVFLFFSLLFSRFLVFWIRTITSSYEESWSFKHGEGERAGADFSQGEGSSSISLSSSVVSQLKGFESSRRARRRSRQELGSSIELSRQTLATTVLVSSLHLRLLFLGPCSNSRSKRRHHLNSPTAECLLRSLSLSLWIPIHQLLDVRCFNFHFCFRISGFRSTLYSDNLNLDSESTSG